MNCSYHQTDFLCPTTCGDKTPFKTFRILKVQIVDIDLDVFRLRATSNIIFFTKNIAIRSLTACILNTNLNAICG